MEIDIINNKTVWKCTVCKFWEYFNPVEVKCITANKETMNATFNVTLYFPNDNWFKNVGKEIMLSLYENDIIKFTSDDFVNNDAKPECPICSSDNIGGYQTNGGNPNNPVTTRIYCEECGCGIDES